MSDTRKVKGKIMAVSTSQILTRIPPLIYYVTVGNERFIVNGDWLRVEPHIGRIADVVVGDNEILSGTFGGRDIKTGHYPADKPQ